MSSQAESKTDSQRFQFASLTMRLKDKLHPPRNRRIKPTATHRDAYTEAERQSVCVLVEQERDVLSSLQYFKALVDKLGVDKLGVERVRLVLDQSVVASLLGGASGRVLEAVQTLVKMKSRLHSSESVASCLARLYHSLAQLIHWADQVTLEGVAPDNKEAGVTTVIRAVLDGVKELVGLAAANQDCPPPVQSTPVVEKLTESVNQETPDVLTCPNIAAPSQNEGVTAPAKPPKVFPRVSSSSNQMTDNPSPPALPPKTRPSSSGPSPCKDLCSSSSAQPASEPPHCWTEEDPDYDFLHKDLSFSQSLPSFPPPSCLPPDLPEKGQPCSEGNSIYEAPSSFGFDSTLLLQKPSHCEDLPDKQLLSPLSPMRTPPPLPEKKRHIHQYLQICMSYSAQSAAMFYQRPLTASQRSSSRKQEVDPSCPVEVFSAPALPPKRRQQDGDGNNRWSKESDTKESSQPLQQEAACGEQVNSKKEQEEEEEVLLINQQEILNRIIMKSEEEEGPDVKAASPDILLVYATETSSTDQSLYCDAFLSTYRSFMSPHNVISKLQHRYRHLCHGVQSAESSSAKKTFNLLARAVEELCAVELDSDLLLLLMDLVFKLLLAGELGPANLIRTNVLSKMEQKWQQIGCPLSLRPLSARSVAARPGTLLDFRSQDLAEQLTLLDSQLFCKIHLPEVLLWSKEQNEERSPNLTEFTQQFNNVSFWVRSVVMVQEKPHDREKLLLKFLKVMKHLRKLNNFNSYLSILSALDSAPLRRLDWQKSTAEALEEYSSLIDSSSSFRAYRSALAEVEPPCIPYLGLILQDLTFVHLGNPDLVMTSEGSKVNFSKRWQQFNILDTVKSYQQVQYSVQPNDEIISFFNDFSDRLAEEALWELSIRLRPRNATRANQR
ncbi:rap guanine nucleotide exchange factor 1-like isoform X2 [Genypterus blacodes]|uniref:rap guanine nucleotide exchange factor 1-like isoform X2 n=1 Tax=Genypterus blacodes TaxID=154954 RepID=UPI003F757D8A